jgi:hypothetical protein
MLFVRHAAAFAGALLVAGCVMDTTVSESDSDYEPVSVAVSELDEIRDCGWATDEIQTVGAYVTDHWTSYKNFVENNAGVSIGNCLENRWKTNGNVECDLTEGSCADNGNVNGWASFLSQTMHICVDPFLDNIQGFGDHNQEACLVALMTHEFGHTCWRDHGSVEDMDDAAFDWYASRSDKNVTITLGSCGMD